ncbi:hypothetical protein GQ600_2740 [Phytophthora cactorum]|nr:hypothetical protein GQ600_2740 [Phytophthora cactorum]
MPRVSWLELAEDGALGYLMLLHSYLIRRPGRSVVWIYLGRIVVGSDAKSLGRRAVPPHASLLRLFVSDVRRPCLGLTQWLLYH